MTAALSVTSTSSQASTVSTTTTIVPSTTSLHWTTIPFGTPTTFIPVWNPATLPRPPARSNSASSMDPDGVEANLGFQVAPGEAAGYSSAAGAQCIEVAIAAMLRAEA